MKTTTISYKINQRLKYPQNKKIFQTFLLSDFRTSRLSDLKHSQKQKIFRTSGLSDFRTYL